MAEYSDNDLKNAAEFRESIHAEALKKIRRVRPDIRDVIDRYPVEAYFQQHWDYPGRWYTVVSIPEGVRSREALVDTIVRDTLSHFNVPETARDPRADRRIDARHYDYKKLFTASVDQENRSCVLIGRDDRGRFIRETYSEYSLGSATGSVSDYEVLSGVEYRQCAKQALEDGHITRDDYERLCKLCGMPKGPKGAAPAPADPEKPPDDPFFALLADYPGCVVDFFLLPADPKRIQGLEEHRRALDQAQRALLAREEEGFEWAYDIRRAKGKRIGVDELFSTEDPADRLNYRKAFRQPPQACGYTDADFDRLNAALFPQGTAGLEVYEWTTDWSDYFDDGREWWGTLCLTVYDKSLRRFVVILASATD